MKNIFKVALLGLAHGLSDCAAGYMIGMLDSQSATTWMDLGSMVLLYNALAFGGQVPAGLLVDRFQHPKWIVGLSLLMVVAALLVFPISPLVAIVLAGIAGAFFHVSGGMLALLAFPGSSVGAGLFAAPGVMGLALGGYLAWMQAPVLWMLAACTSVVLLLALSLPYPQQNDAPQEVAKPDTLEWHDLFMVILLLAIAMRSAVWNVFELIHAQEHTLLLGLGVAAMLGKIVGGFLAQRFGWRRYAVGALLLAAPMLSFGARSPYLLLPGIFLLQSATPAAVLGMYKLMPRMPATAIGMCFGLAIAAGGIPTMAGWQPAPWLFLIILPLVAFGYAFSMRMPKSV
jgi:MFS transporter, FSR family, fosmidomycin resistance protein